MENILFFPYQDRDHLTDSLSVGDVHIVSLLPALEGLIVPSKYYGIAAAGRPAIFISDTDGEIATLLKHNDCGLCVASGDGKGLVSAVHELMEDPAKRKAMGSNARKLFERCFDKPVAVAAWNDLLDEVARDN